MSQRHSLYWRLFALVGGFCLALTWLSGQIGNRINRDTSYLSEAARDVLTAYGVEAAQQLREGPAALARWRQSMAQREPGWLVVIDQHLNPLDGSVLNAAELRQLTFARHYEWPMSRRSETLPLVAVPLDASHQLVMRLPERFRPWRHRALLRLIGVVMAPALLSGLFCWLLYIVLITPLERLRRQANALRESDVEARVPSVVSHRRDELGELGRALEALTHRLHDSLTQQRQLLHDVSHELRTPLSRLRVACDGALSAEELRERVDRETGAMARLVEETLRLAWLDSAPPQLELEPIDIEPLWSFLAEDAGFEAGWPPARIVAALPAECRVLGSLNALAQAMENILRNAVRHSPADSSVRLVARRHGEDWILTIADQGPGIAAADLPVIFRPFARLAAARPGDGFGLGLAIAERMVRLQGGAIWAENGSPGLRVSIRLPAA